MKYFYLLILSVLISISFGSCSKSKKEGSKPKKMNVLFVSIDDLGPNLGVYDNPIVVSPNLDSFANDGMVFRRTYCQAAVCAPSRASLMTGFRPDSTRVWHLGDKFRKIHPDIKTIPQYFHDEGYYTACIGKIFHNYMPDSVSWDEPDKRPAQYLRPEWLKRDGETFYVNKETQRKQKIKRDKLIAKRPNYYADGWNNGPAWEWEDVHDSMYFDGAQTELAKRTLSRLAKNDEPFFLALGYFRPHLPFAVPKKYWDMYDRNEIPLASNPYVPSNSPIMSMNSMYELRGYDGFKNLKHPTENAMSEDTARILKHGYYASISYVDAQFGKIINHLKQLGIYDNTIIVVWGDHGWKLGEHNGWGKMTNYNIDIHVPLLVYTPTEMKRGEKTFEITELVDIAPSLFELAGIPKPKTMQGQSFVPLLKNPETKWKSAAFSQFHRRPKVTPDGGRYMGYSIKTKKYHYVRWYTWDHEKGEHGDFVTDELYDNTIDWDENVNVVTDSNYSEILEKLKIELEAGWRNAKAQLE